MKQCRAVPNSSISSAGEEQEEELAARSSLADSISWHRNQLGSCNSLICQLVQHWVSKCTNCCLPSISKRFWCWSTQSRTPEQMLPQEGDLGAMLVLGMRPPPRLWLLSTRLWGQVATAAHSIGSPFKLGLEALAHVFHLGVCARGANAGREEGTGQCC